MAEVLGDIVFILFLVLANGFFVAAEFAMVKVRLSQLEERIKQGYRRAVVAKHIVEHIDAYLSATQLGITLSSLGLGWVGEPLLAELLAGPFVALGIVSDKALHAVSFAVSFGILTFLLIILGELGPKSYAIRHPEATSYMTSLPLQLFYQVFKPAIWVLNRSANIMLRFLGIPLTRSGEMYHSAEELEIIVNEGARSGVLNKTEQELITSIFEFSTTTAKEIMVPRTEMVALDINKPREHLIRVVTEEGYSRLPVFKESLDNIVGIIYTKDLINLLEDRDLIVIQDILRPPYFVPESVKISKLMRDLQEQKIHMAVVVDEFGGTQGLVTMEDILEEIVGEIHDEYDEVLKDVEQSADGAVLVNARISIKDFNDRFGEVIPEDAEYDTLSGFLNKITGRIPEMHEEIKYNNLQFTVVKKSQRRIRQVKMRKVPQSSATS
ncbi:MAG: hemolysin family protein [Bacteroidota bacterium]|jgi:CBS domain containing-hemolysin-like protein